MMNPYLRLLRNQTISAIGIAALLLLLSLTHACDRQRATDVPAIEVFTAQEVAIRCQQIHACEQQWTCADEERILETSENGKHWCRKVQNGGNL